jgi:hypothetical protein
MTQTSEPGIGSEHSEGKRDRAKATMLAAVTCSSHSAGTARCAVVSTRSSPLGTGNIVGQQGWHEHLASTAVTQCSTTKPASRSWRRVVNAPASRSAAAPRLSAWRDVLQEIAGATAAFAFAGLARALALAAFWHEAKIAFLAFTFIFAVALDHALLLGLPLFLIFRSKGWINVMLCVVFGFAVGSAPAGVLTWPIQHPELHTTASVDGVPTIINGVIAAAGWVSHVKPLFYFGSFGALRGFAFWVDLIWFGILGDAATTFNRLRASSRLRHPVKSA